MATKKNFSLKSPQHKRYADTTAEKSQSAVARATSGTRDTDARRAKRNYRLRGPNKRQTEYNDYLSGATRTKSRLPKRMRTSQGTKEAPV